MKKIALLSTIFILCALAFTSCSMQKRHYRNGYYINFHNEAKVEESPSVDSEIGIVESSIVLTGSRELPNSFVEKHDNFTSVESDVEVTDSRLEKPSRIAVNCKVSYGNSFETKSVECGATSAKNSPAPPDGEQTTNKSQLVALLLCLFFGVLGIHRFYLGYIGIGIIQILTAGGCGIWVLIDLILIITGDLKPKNGEYGSKF